jgi:hypothetical protein
MRLTLETLLLIIAQAMVVTAMPVWFAQDIQPLFTVRDIACMQRQHVRLDDYGYMSDPAGNDDFPDHANAREVYAHLAGTAEPRMPLGGPYWSDDQLKLFAQWMTDGFLA